MTIHTCTWMLAVLKVEGHLDDVISLELPFWQVCSGSITLISTFAVNVCMSRVVLDETDIC